MALDMTLLRVMKHRQDYNNLRRMIPERALDAATDTILKDYGKWFKEHPEAEVIDMESFPLWVKLAHPTVSDEKMILIQAQLRRAVTDVDQDVRAGIVERLLAAQTAQQLEDLVVEFASGADMDFAAKVKAIVDRYDTLVARRVKTPFVEVDIDELLDEEENDEGIKYRLGILNEHMRPARPGDCILWAMRPDSGKTSILCSEATFWAPQCPDGRGVFWFNNEGPGKKIVGRLWNAALNANWDELIELRDKGKHKQMYAAAVGGSDRIRVLDIHDQSTTDVEDYIREHNPYIVIIDMADNLSFGGVAAHGGQRTDQILEALYQWARVLGVKHDCIVHLTSQISAEGDGLSRPALSMLKDSKTGKQGAVDAAVMIGRSNDPLMQSSRWINIPKNKLARSNAPSDPAGFEVIFDSKRSRYLMPDEAAVDGD